MATPRRYPDYPLQYTELLRRALTTPIRVSFPSAIYARRFRNYLYAFRQSIRDADASEGVPDDIVVTSPLISFKVDGTAVVVYKPKRVSNIVKALDTTNVE